MPLNWSFVTEEALQSLDFDHLLAGVEERECMAYGDELSRVERDNEQWTPAQRECLRFAGLVVTMMLRPDQPSDPFGPMFVIDERRSALPSDFPRPELLRLQDWMLSLRDAELRARFLDLLWVQGKSFVAAQGAVEAYLETALRLEHPEHWPPCVERAERALRLSASLGRGGATLKGRVLGEIDAMVSRHRGEDPLYLSLRLIRLLLEFRHGDYRRFAQYAGCAATAAERTGDFWRARDHYQLAAECYRSVGDVDAEAAALRDSAEALVKEAESARSQSGRGAMVAAAVLSDAVEAMRQAPGGKERASELHERLLVFQAEAVAELKPLSTSIDATELVNRSIAAVRGKPLREAVICLCELARPPALEQLKQQVHEQARVAVLGCLFQSDVLNSRGRVVARAPGLEPGADDTNDAGLRWRLFQCARLARGLTVQAMLNPARAELLAEHAPDRQDVVALIQQSPWIPPGHLESVSRALVAGFQGDMLVAGHLVPPQFEALVRHVVESEGGATSMLEPGGLQPERPLGVLLETPEALRAFGEAGIFELQDLFVDPLGTNLRNEVAHGLLGDSGLFGTEVLYAWWLLLRYSVLTSLLIERRRAAEGSAERGQ